MISQRDFVAGLDERVLISDRAVDGMHPDRDEPEEVASEEDVAAEQAAGELEAELADEPNDPVAAAASRRDEAGGGTGIPARQDSRTEAGKNARPTGGWQPPPQS